jgi:predicted nucleic acid-binding protein
MAGRRRAILKLLADTSALIALFLPDERNHRRAADVGQRRPEPEFVLTELILGELATRLHVLAGVHRAVAIANDVLRSSRYQLVFTDRELLNGGLEKMARFSDQRLSLTDCVSFDLMEKLGLPAAFTFDRDFRDCGYETVP